jgi:hypothetical protein
MEIRRHAAQDRLHRCGQSGRLKALEPMRVRDRGAVPPDGRGLQAAIRERGQIGHHLSTEAGCGVRPALLHQVAKWSKSER